MTLDLRLDGGAIARPYGDPSVESVGISRGKIVAVGDLRNMPAGRVIDVSGAFVLPGIIDTHVHIGFTDATREVSTETRAAAIGGVTTALIYFRNPAPYDEILPEFIAMGTRDAYVDFAVHLGILNDAHLDRLDEYISRFGIRSLKMYTTYKGGELRQYGVVGQDDGFVFDVFRSLARRRNVIAAVHCENDDMIRRGSERWFDSAAPTLEQWSQARPPIAEVEAVRRIGLLAREAGARLYIPHISSAQALGAALEERSHGANISIETCPHYLHADAIAMAGQLGKVNPPVRRAEDAAALWSALATGLVDTVGSDHAALMRHAKLGDSIIAAKPGFPGVGTLLPALLDGVNQGFIALRNIAAAQASAASIFELPSKGRVEPGYDADLVVVDMSVKRVVDVSALGGISDFSPFEGVELHGWPVMTLARGQVIASDGEFHSSAARGQYLRPMTHENNSSPH